LKRDYKLRFLAQPGTTSAQFEAEWPSMLRELQREGVRTTLTPAEEYAAYRRRQMLGRVE
jgi:hypothetical protein